MQRRLNRFRHRGETLLEVVVAITIMIAVLTSVFTLLIQVSAGNVNVVNRVTALNIAKEGVEAVRNIRDTNWLKYSGDRRGKWLCLDTVLPLDTLDTRNACTPGLAGTYIDNKVYRIELSETYNRYYLQAMEAPENFTNKDILPAEDFRLYEDSGTGRSYHDNTGEAMAFYRQILLTPETTVLNGTCGAIPEADCVQDIRLNVVSRVQWKEGNKVRSLDLETYLYDFLGRESY